MCSLNVLSKVGAVSWKSRIHRTVESFSFITEQVSWLCNSGTATKGCLMSLSTLCHLLSIGYVISLSHLWAFLVHLPHFNMLTVFFATTKYELVIWLCSTKKHTVPSLLPSLSLQSNLIGEPFNSHVNSHFHGNWGSQRGPDSRSSELISCKGTNCSSLLLPLVHETGWCSACWETLHWWKWILRNGEMLEKFLKRILTH